MLLVSVPLMVVLAWLLTVASSSSLTSSAKDQESNVARGVALHIEDWFSERQEQVGVIAKEASGQLDSPALTRLLVGVQRSGHDYELIQVMDLTGRAITSSRPGTSLTATGQDWFRTASSGKPAITSLTRVGDQLRWVIAAPIVGPDGQPEGVVAADLNAAELAVLLNPELDNGSQVIAVDSNHALLYDTAMGPVASSTALLAAGALHSTLDNNATHQAIATGEPGATRYTDQNGHDTIAGFDRVDALGWVILVQDPSSAVLAPVNTERNRAILIVILGSLLAGAVSLLLASRMTRPIRRLTAAARKAADGELSVRVEPEGSSELLTLGESFNAMLDTSEGLVDRVQNAGVDVNSAAAELSASSEELAAITTQQSAAVTQATSTTEELARASSAIADTVDQVATQTAETKDNLEQAEADIALSSERTLALARKVNDIDALLDLINEIADQTNLLALNAAIEAARAGENGLGFAVVADEVRRLAERSKTSAGEINTIIRAVQGETNATVMAMEKGAKQMQQGLILLEAVTDANAQVRMTTQQQRGATSQVVETMEQLTDSSRQVATAADQIASAAGNLADLAGNLEATATKTKARY
jgi:methyl-accepting chemotaxis protein